MGSPVGSSIPHKSQQFVIYLAIYMINLYFPVKNITSNLLLRRSSLARLTRNRSPLHYKKKNGETIQLSHDIRGREDLLLPRQKLILELKQVAKLTDKDFYQLARYMQERCDNSPWSTDTRGLLINFGDTQLECWYLFYDKTTNRLQRVWSKVKNKATFESLIDTSYCAAREPARL
jgi:hypothetical protein